MKDKKVDDDFKYDWAIFAYNYLNIANLACSVLLNPQTIKYKEDSPILSKKQYRPGDLFVAILYNAKHGIEIFIKTLNIFAYGSYDDNQHDIDILFKDVRSKLDKSGINSSTLENKILNIEELIRYFYNIDFLKQKIGVDYTIIDIKNDIFRYPDNRASVKLRWDQILDNRINNDDIEELKKKIDQIAELFSEVIPSIAEYIPEDQNRPNRETKV